MGAAALEWKLGQLEKRFGTRPATASPVLDEIRADPSQTMRLAGLTPDPWQESLLRSSERRRLVLTCRQAGKSTVGASLALQVALLLPKSLTLLLSPSQRQSTELHRKVMDLYGALGRPVEPAVETIQRLELTNGSRIIALPGDGDRIRGFSAAALLVIDEAARVRDDLYQAVRPMLAVSRGRLVCLTTPAGKLGWFFEAWQGAESWERVQIPATQCGRIHPDFLAEEERSLGARWYAQEYGCSFEDVAGSLFAYDVIQAAISSDLQPLFAGG